MRIHQKHIFILLLVCLAYVSPAQQSMMANVNYQFLEKLIATAKQNYPRMKKYDHKITQTKLGVNKAKLAWFDGLTFSYIYNSTTTNTQPGNNSALGYQPGFFFNVGNLLSKPATIKIAREEQTIAEADKEEYELNIEAIVKARYYGYIEKLAILNLRTKSASEADNSQTQIKYKFENGIETFDNYSKVLVLYSVSSQNKIEAEAAVLVAKSALEEIIGIKLEDVK